MYTQKCKSRKLNRALTNMIIELHDRGYTEDFSIIDVGGKLVLTPDGTEYLDFRELQVSVINQFFDRLTFRYSYLHAIETNCGRKGIILSNSVHFIDSVQPVIAQNRYAEMHPFRRSHISCQPVI